MEIVKTHNTTKKNKNNFKSVGVAVLGGLWA